MYSDCTAFSIIHVPIAVIQPMPVAARSKAWACGRSVAGIAVSNLAAGMGVCRL